MNARILPKVFFSILETSGLLTAVHGKGFFFLNSARFWLTPVSTLHFKGSGSCRALKAWEAVVSSSPLTFPVAGRGRYKQETGGQKRSRS